MSVANPLFDSADVVTLPSDLNVLNRPSGAGGRDRTNARFEAQKECIVFPAEVKTILATLPAESPKANDGPAPIFSSRPPATVNTTEPKKPAQQMHHHHHQHHHHQMSEPPQYHPQYASYDRRMAPPVKSPLKNVPCRFNLSGSCTKGENCQFGHFDPEAVVPAEYPPMYYGSAPPPQQSSGYYRPAPAGPPPPPGSFQSAIPPHPDWQPSPAPSATHWSAQRPPGAPGVAPPAARPAPTAVPVEEEEETDSTVTTLRAKLEALRGNCVFPALKVVLEEWEEEEKKVVVGLKKNDIGLTRFQSLLIKRSLCHLHEGKNAAAMESIAEWERKLAPWLPVVGVPFARCFEEELCGRAIEVLRCMASSRFARFRLPEGVLETAKTDPTATMLGFWEQHAARLVQQDLSLEFPDADIAPHTPPQPSYTAYFTHDSGLPWTPATHRAWPAPFRGRMRAFFLSMTKLPTHYDLSLRMIGMGDVIICRMLTFSLGCV